MHISGKFDNVRTDIVKEDLDIEDECVFSDKLSSFQLRQLLIFIKCSISMDIMKSLDEVLSENY